MQINGFSAKLAKSSKKEIKAFLDFLNGKHTNLQPADTPDLRWAKKEAKSWLTTRKIEKELARVQKKDRKGKELRGCKGL